MPSQTILIIVAVIVVILIVAFAAFALSGRRTAGRSQPPSMTAPTREAQRPRAEAPVAQAPAAPVAPPPPPRERVPAPTAAQIEELVRPKLAKYSDLRRVKIEFGTALDGSLEVWLGPSRYDSVDEVPDQRLRKAIQEAVAELNRNEGG